MSAVPQASTDPVDAATLLGPTPAPRGLAPASLAALDQALLSLRRIMAKPVSTTLPVPCLGRRVDLTKVMACEVLASPREGDGPMTVKDLAGALHLDHSTTSRMLGEAEAEGLVNRGSDPEDRRRTSVTLTETGRGVAADGAYIRTWFMGHVLSDWDPADVDLLAALLHRAVSSFSGDAAALRVEAEKRLGLSLPMDHLTPTSP